MAADMCPMMQDILEQSQVMRRCIEQARNGTKDFVQLFRGNHFQHIFLCGSGTVATAGYVLKHTARRMLGIESTMTFSNLLLRHSDFSFPCQPPARSSLLICPSETGYTKGPVELARLAKRYDVPSVCTVRDQDNPLARECTVVVEKLSGTERALPSTKGYTAGLLQLTLCIAAAAIDSGTISAEDHVMFNRTLELLPGKCQTIVEAADAWFRQWGDLLTRAPYYRIIGYGANYGTAMEGALKFEEAHKRLSKAYEMEEFLHGPAGAVRAGDVILFLFGESGYERDRMEALYRSMTDITANCIAIGAVPETAVSPQSLRLPVSDCQELNPIELVIPLQVMACRTAQKLGMDTTKVMNPSVKKALQPGYQKNCHE